MLILLRMVLRIKRLTINIVTDVTPFPRHIPFAIPRELK